MVDERSAAERLGGLSLVEYEYAYAYAEHLSVGDVRPDPSGFDPERIAVIERTLDAVWRRHTQRIRRRR